MRWLICLVLVGSAAEARAELVVSEPPIVRRCARAKTWDKIVDCITKIGFKAKVTKTLPRAKLITLHQKQGTKEVDVGFLFYVEKNGEWQIGGRLETYGADYRLLKIEPVTVGKKTGFRLDIGQESPFTLMVDNITPVPAQLITRRSLFCNGDSYHCPEATTLCEIEVQGQTWFLFHGTFQYEDNAINVTGDRSRAGVHCNIPPKVYLGWR